MSRRDKTKEVFVELVNLQLAPHGKTYEDVVGDPEWYMRYKTTREAEVAFQEEGVKILREKLRMTKTMAEREMSWFILQWGLTTTETFNELSEEAQKIIKTDTSD